MSTSTSRPARCWPSSGRTAPARAPCSRPSPGLLAPFSGSVDVFGGPAKLSAKRIAYVPQAELVDWSFPVTVGDVVMMGRVPLIGIGRSPGRADREAVAEALETVRMADERDRQIGALSGGQRRRVFLAKALAARPDLYLLDEPVTGVDVTTQEDLMRILEAEAAAGRTVVATTHDLASAAHHFHQAAFINGRVVAFGRGRSRARSGPAGGDLRRARHRPAGRRPDDHRRRPSSRPIARRRTALPRRGGLTCSTSSSSR